MVDKKYGCEKSAFNDLSLKFLQWTLDQHSRIARLHHLLTVFQRLSKRYDMVADNKCQLPAGKKQAVRQ